MAPELALEAIGSLPPHSTVVDLMCGSGTTLRLGVEAGHRVVGFDLDPLAVLISRVSCHRSTRTRIVDLAERIVAAAVAVKKPVLPWMDSETEAFTEFWFASEQRDQLRRLAWALNQHHGGTSDVLRVALSRTIVTKNAGASLARDVSHSRPHLARATNDYDVYRGFLAGANLVADLVDRPVTGSATISLGDARKLPSKIKHSADLVITSPPYVNAIDYMRGHRLSLVWFGHNLRSLRSIRSTSVGAERGLSSDEVDVPPFALKYAKLPPREQGMLNRYSVDILALMTQIVRALKPKAKAVLVVGDSTIRGEYIENSKVVEAAAKHVGLELKERKSRPLPASSRYLPPPTSDGSAMSKRMRTEIVLTFQAAA